MRPDNPKFVICHFRFSLEQIDQAVNYLDENLNTPVICFDGPMGAGKTTLISELCQKMAVTDPFQPYLFDCQSLH